MPEPMFLDPEAKRIPFSRLEKETPEVAQSFRMIAECEGISPDQLTILKRGGDYSAVLPFRKFRDARNDESRTGERPGEAPNPQKT